MASLPITAWPAEPAHPVQVTKASLVPVKATAPAVASKARLSALEWSVVALAERDTIASLREPGRIAAALENLFSLAPPSRLADPRLEVLRRVAVFAWRQHWKVPASELKAFLAEGFTLEHYELIQASIASSRARYRQRGAGR